MTKSIFSNEHKLIISKLRLARRTTGLEQEQVAKLIGKTQSYVSKVESGQRRIDIVQLKEFAKIYRKDITYFLPK